MSLSLVSTENNGFRPLSAEDLKLLQAEQFEHDEGYHREITRLPVQKRITHMALHFSKYVGRLFEGADDERALTDIFVIALSSANILGIHLQTIEHFEAAKEDDSRGRFVATLARASGRMSAACEKLDHLEEYPYRPTLSEAVLSISTAAQTFAASKNLDLSAMVRVRLVGVRHKVFKPGG